MISRSFAIFAAICLGTAVFAHANATGIVKERMDGMKAISKAMKTVLAETHPHRQTQRRSNRLPARLNPTQARP